MDAETLHFFRENQADIEQLLARVEFLRGDMRQKLKSLETLIDTSTCAMTVVPGYYRPPELLSDMLVYTVKPSDTLQLNVVIHLKPTGWQINVHHALGDQLHRRQAVEAFLNARGVPVRPRNYPNVWRLGYGSDAFTYDMPLAEVQEEVQRLFTQLGSSPHEAPAASLSEE